VVSCPARVRRPYQRGGIVTQHKSSKTLAFKPLARALGEPAEFLLSDFSKVGVQGG
jgi:ubiquitin-activating enzyme E1